MHNTYFTLPVVFSMLAIHYANAWSHEWNWLVLAGFMLAGALIRQFFVLWHSGGRAWWLLAAGGAVLVVLAFALAPRPTLPAPPASTPPPPATTDGPGTPGDGASDATPATVTTNIEAAPVDTAFVHALAAKHCTSCHSATPKLMPSAPKGMMFDTPEQIDAHAALINQQVVVAKVMPPGNMTQMTEEERAAIARWFQAEDTVTHPPSLETARLRLDPLTEADADFPLRVAQRPRLQALDRRSRRAYAAPTCRTTCAPAPGRCTNSTVSA